MSVRKREASSHLPGNASHGSKNVRIMPSARASNSGGWVHKNGEVFIHEVFSNTFTSVR